MDGRGATLDSAVIEAYRNQADTVDDILTDPPSAKAFADEVKARMAPQPAPDDRMILRRLITLRKRGKDRGGLSREGDQRRKPR